MKPIKYLVWLGKIGRATYKAPLLGACLVAFTTFLGSLTFGFQYLVPLVVFIITFSWWILTTDTLYSGLTRRLIRSRFENPMIGVIASKEIDNAQMNNLTRSSEFSPDDWSRHLKEQLKEQFKVEQTGYNEIDTDFPMIINPFGELYLEEDLSNLKTFERIKHYIENGGVFVNTGGLAFFYMWNPETKIDGLTGPMIETYILDDKTKVLRPIVLSDNSTLINTWLYNNFGVRTTVGNERRLQTRSANGFNIIKDNTEVLEFRSAMRCESQNAKLIPILRAEYTSPTARRYECYPIAAIKYGLGYLILVGMRLNEKKDLNLVINAIKKVCNRLSKEGTLES